MSAPAESPTGIGGARLDLIVLDCPDPQALAQFYADTLGWTVSRHDDDGWSEVRGPSGLGLAFQPAPDHVAPTWPEATVPQQIHLDIDVDDMESAQRHVLALGATATGLPATGSDSFRVFRDPAGHPFCLCRASAPDAVTDVAGAADHA